MTKTLRLTTRSIRTAEAIRDRRDFITSGTLRGNHVERPGYLYDGHLSGLDAEALSAALRARVIDYVVWSYSTPIAWHMSGPTVKGGSRWHIVAQTFSVTTSKHQGNLYLCSPRGNGDRGYNPVRRWCGMKGGVNQGYDVLAFPGSDQVLGHADTKGEADSLAWYIRLNGLPESVTA